MKVSNFLVTYNKDDEYLIYSTRTTALVKLKMDEYEEIFNNHCYDREDLVDALKKTGILIEDDFDELEQLNELRKVALDSKTQNVTFVTTSDCNARCYYCFENNIKKIYMSYETADKSIEYIRTHMKDKQLGIIWFGGEPLLNFDIIKYITEHLLDLGYELVARVITNGSRLDNEKIDYFINNYKDLTIEITIDDINEEYQRIKDYVDPERDNYDIVICNLKNIVKTGIKTVIRINFAASEIERAKKVYEYLIDVEKLNSDYENIYIYLAPLTLECAEENISRYHGNGEHPYLQAIKLQNEKGFPLGMMHGKKHENLLETFGLKPNAYSCGNTTVNRITIDANGDIYKCHRMVGRKEFCVGNVNEGIDANNIVYQTFRQDIITDEKCKSCNILPICQGGCKAQKYMNKSGFGCHRIKQVSRQLLAMYYECIKKDNEMV